MSELRNSLTLVRHSNLHCDSIRCLDLHTNRSIKPNKSVTIPTNFFLTIPYFLNLSLNSLTVSKGITQEFNLDRGSRQKGKLEDLMDDPDVRESVLDNVSAVVCVCFLLRSLIYDSIIFLWLKTSCQYN